MNIVVAESLLGRRVFSDAAEFFGPGWVRAVYLTNNSVWAVIELENGPFGCVPIGRLKSRGS